MPWRKKYLIVKRCDNDKAHEEHIWERYMRVECDGFSVTRKRVHAPHTYWRYRDHLCKGLKRNRDRRVHRSSKASS